MFAGVGHHDWFAGSIGILDPTKGSNYPHGLTKVTADLRWPECSIPPEDPVESDRYHASGTFAGYMTAYPLVGGGFPGLGPQRHDGHPDGGGFRSRQVQTLPDGRARQPRVDLRGRPQRVACASRSGSGRSRRHIPTARSGRVRGRIASRTSRARSIAPMCTRACPDCPAASSSTCASSSRTTRPIRPGTRPFVIRGRRFDHPGGSGQADHFGGARRSRRFGLFRSAFRQGPVSSNCWTRTTGLCRPCGASPG